MIFNARAFLFCDRASGAIRFQVAPTPTGELPAEEAASLLAMHCLVRGQTPKDYIVLVAPREDLNVNARAQQILQGGRTAAGLNVKLSPRQREVLDQVLLDRSNKEIGSRLNISERTAKFHVAKLLAKFNAANRASLKHEVAIWMLPGMSDSLWGSMVPAEVMEKT